MLAVWERKVERYISAQTLTLVYAALIGVGGGYGAVGFRKLIETVSFLFFHRTTAEVSSYYGIRSIIAPALGGLLVGLIVYFFAREAKGHGVPEVMFAITEKKGIIRPRVVVAKALASAISIGSGGSVGREGPIVQIGSAWGSAFGQFLGIREKHLKTLVACGAAAGIAATFNAPIGGVLFAAEVILGSFAVTNISALVISAVISAAIGRMYFGNVASFPIPHYEVHGIPALLAFAVLGVIGGLFGVLYTRVLFGMELLWDRFTRLPEWFKPALGGLIIGVVGFWYPQIFGVGYPSVEHALMGQLGIGLLLLLLVLKLLMTSVTLASGGSGGVFAPGLFMGAMLGGAFGLVFTRLFPGLHITDGVFAVAGMAAVFTGSAQAPITAMIMLFEMTNNYQLILPLMLTAVVANSVSNRLMRDSIYTMKLKKRGYDIVTKRSSDRLSAILVHEAMHPEALTVLADDTMNEARMSFDRCNEWFAAVRDEHGRLIGSISKTQVLERIYGGDGDVPVRSIVPREIGHVNEHATLAEASRVMNRLGTTFLLVENARGEAIGVIGSSDIVRAYRSN